MNFSDIKTMTYIGNTVDVNGRDVQIETKLDDSIDAVQFHKGRDFCLEEPLMEQVPLEKYQYVLDEYVKAIDIIDNPPIVEPTVEEIKKNIENAIQSMLDNQAIQLGYDNIVSACSYAGYANEFQDEAVKLGVWRSAVWTKAFAIQKGFEEVGTIPTVEEVLEQLPKYEI